MSHRQDTLPGRDILAAMSDRPPELDDQDSVRSGLQIGGGILVGLGGLLALGGFADFFGSMGSTSAPTHFWMLFIGLPMIGLGVRMLKGGFLGTTTRYVAGEVAPTVKDTLEYVGVGGQKTTCAKCGGTNDADAKFCDNCGAALSISCPSCGHTNAADSAFCSACGKPLTPA